MEIKGTKENPYSWGEYNEMFKDKKWYGGWVRIGGELRYITKDGHEEMDNSGGVLGSIDNPFSETAYEEMHSRGDWPGGYVSFSGFPEYRRSSAEENADASGCGSSGSGSDFGCGSGSGASYLIPGSEIIGLPGSRDGKDGHYKVEISWEANGGANAKIIGFYTSSMGVEDYDGGSISNVTVEGYTVIIPFNGFEYRFEIPEIYHVKV